MSIVRLKQGGKYLAMENRKFKLVDSETACADMEQFVMTMDRVNKNHYSIIHIVNLLTYMGVFGFVVVPPFLCGYTLPT